jgi:hypothetical protein
MISGCQRIRSFLGSLHFLFLAVTLVLTIPAAGLRAQVINLYENLLDPRAIARLDGPFSQPMRGAGRLNLPPETDPVDGAGILAQDTGAGVIAHFWLVTTTADSLTRVRLWVDDSLVVSCTALEFFTKAHGPISGPLVYLACGGQDCDLQIPYKRNFRITFLKLSQALVYYGIEWHPIPNVYQLPDLSTDKFRLSAEKAYSSNLDPWEGQSFDSLFSSGMATFGDTLTIASIDGPAMIHKMTFYPSILDSVLLDSLILEIRWDYRDEPAVRVSLGDLFGTVAGLKDMRSQYIQTDPSGRLQITFPMPFRSHASIQLINLTQQSQRVETRIQYSHEAIDPNLYGYFSTQSHESNPTRYGVFHPLLHTLGRGKYVGTLLQMPALSSPVALEGDPVFIIDSNPRTSFHFSGTEDYFNAGFYFMDGPFTLPFAGLLHWCNVMYRFHCMDAMPYDRSFDLDLHHGEGNDVREDYRSTAFYYEHWTPFRASRDTVRAGEEWHIKGAGYQPGEHLTIKLDNDSIGGTTADMSGRLFWSRIVSESWRAGVHSVAVNDEASPQLLFVIATPTLRMLTDSDLVILEIGDSLKLTGAGFERGEQVVITSGSRIFATDQPIIVGTDHRFFTQFHIPIVAKGYYPIRALGTKSGLSNTKLGFTVTDIRNYEFENLVPPSFSENSKWYYNNTSLNTWAHWGEQGFIEYFPNQFGDTISFRFWTPTPSFYHGYLFLSLAGGYGVYDYSIDGRPLGSFDSYKHLVGNAYIMPSDSIDLSEFPLDSGYHQFTFRYVHLNPNADVGRVGPDHFVLIPAIALQSSESNGGQRKFSAEIAQFPNPAASSVIFLYELSATEYVTLRVYKISGDEIATPVRGIETAGKHEVVLDTRTLANGVYQYRLTGPDWSRSGKLVIQR